MGLALCVCFEKQMNREKLMKMANTVRTGGKGTVRRYTHLCLFCEFVFLPFFMLYSLNILTLISERRRLFTRPLQPMTRGSRALLRELESIPFPPLKKLTFLRMM